MNAQEIRSDLERMRVGDVWESPADMPELYRAIRFEDGWVIQWASHAGAVDLAEGLGSREAAELIIEESQIAPEGN